MRRPSITNCVQNTDYQHYVINRINTATAIDNTMAITIRGENVHDTSKVIGCTDTV